MNKTIRQHNLQTGEDDLQSLAAFDYHVHQFSAHHFRINRRLDVWPSTRRWYDHHTNIKGMYTELLPFVKGYLPRHEH